MGGPPYLTLAEQACLLQPGPDALDPASVLGVHVCVPAHALVLQHERVVDHTWARHTPISQHSFGPGCASLSRAHRALPGPPWLQPLLMATPAALPYACSSSLPEIPFPHHRLSAVSLLLKPPPGCLTPPSVLTSQHLLLPLSPVRASVSCPPPPHPIGEWGPSLTRVHQGDHRCPYRAQNWAASCGRAFCDGLRPHSQPQREGKELEAGGS